MSQARVKKALSIFAQQKQRLTATEIYKWMKYSADLTEIYIGPDTQLRHAWFGLIKHGSHNLVQDADNLIDMCIISINDNGVYTPAKDNFLRRFNNWELSGTLVIVVIGAMGFAWGLGIGFNQFRIESLASEVTKSESEIKRLKGQISNYKVKLTKAQKFKDSVNIATGLSRP